MPSFDIWVGPNIVNQYCVFFLFSSCSCSGSFVSMITGMQVCLWCVYHFPAHFDAHLKFVFHFKHTSTASQTCIVTRTYSTFGGRAFAPAGTGLWNSLPLHLKDADLSYSEFWRSLKTFLFGQWGHGAVWTVLTAQSRNIHTYLLTLLMHDVSSYISAPTWVIMWVNRGRVRCLAEVVYAYIVSWPQHSWFY